MAITTASALKIAPSAAAGVSITSGAGSWANGTWQTLLTSTGAAAVLMGWPLFHSLAAGTSMEIDIGYGGAGAEVVLATFPFRGPNSGNTGQFDVHPVIPISGIPASTRIAARCRNASASQTCSLLAMYYESFDSDHVTAKAPSPMPSAAVGSNMTPSGTAWNNSGWVQCTAGESTPILLGYWVSNPPNVAVDYEIEIGFGGSGSEVAQTVIRSAWPGNSGCAVFWVPLPAALPVPVSTRVSTRIRKTGTSTATWSTGFMYYADLGPVVGRSFAQAFGFG